MAKPNQEIDLIPHTFSSQLVHCVFSTKKRLPTIDSEWRPQLHTYLGGITRENRCNAIAVGGTADHVHLLLSIPPSISTARALQWIKRKSSLWAHETFPRLRGFTWQEEYGTFSIGISQVDDTVTYINRQETHHQTVSFQDEFRQFLKRHGTSRDERNIWG